MPAVQEPPTSSNEMTALLNALVALKKGESGVRLPVEWTGIAGKVADAFNDVVELNERMSSDLARMSQVVGKEGKLHQRLSVGDASGFWNESVQSVNDLIDDLVHPNMRTEGLLQQSQSLTQQLQVRQEQLEQTNEELQEKAHLLAQQNQEVERKNSEVEQARQELEEKAKQLALFLADAGAVLGRSLDIGATAKDIVRLPVPFLAEVSILKLNPIVGERQQILVARATAEPQSAVSEWNESEPLPAGVKASIHRVMVSAQSELLKSHPDNPLASGIVLPLQARGRTFAVLALSSPSAEGAFDANNFSTAEAFSSRAAIALDNALLHEEIRWADRQKNDFLSMLAHELRNPLAPIRNAVQLLEIRVPDEPEVKWACEVIDRQVFQMVRLVDDLLDVARITRDKIRLHTEPLELSTVVERAVEASRPIIDLRKHQLQLTVDPQPIWIEGDLARLTQVLTNLLNNAAKYTEEGGQIWLSAGQEDDSALIRVRDHGIGIPPQMLESVFDLFTQVDRALDRSHGGLGIGLTLVKRLVEMHHGTVEALSDGQGHGSEFTVRLPIVNRFPVEPVADEHPETSAENGRTRRILVVDDNRDSARTLSMMLRLMGHQTSTAHDGLEAIEVATAYKPDMILLDIGLPKMNGYEVCRRLRELPFGRSALIVALTGWGQDDDRRRSTEAGFDRHLVKPIDLAVLSDLLASSKLTGETVTS